MQTYALFTLAAVTPFAYLIRDLQSVRMWRARRRARRTTREIWARYPETQPGRAHGPLPTPPPLQRRGQAMPPVVQGRCVGTAPTGGRRAA